MGVLNTLTDTVPLCCNLPSFLPGAASDPGHVALHFHASLCAK